MNNQMLGEIHEGIRSAGVENGVRQISGDFLDPFRRDTTGAARPIIFRRRARQVTRNLKIGFSFSTSRNSVLKMMSFLAGARCKAR